MLDHEYLLGVVLYCYTNTRPKIHNNNVLEHGNLLGVVLYCYTNTRPKIHNNNVLDHEHLLGVVPIHNQKYTIIMC